MAEEVKSGPGKGRGLTVAGVVSAVVWLLVLAVLAVLPFFVPFNLHHGVFPSSYGSLWVSWSLLGVPVFALNLFLVVRRRPRVLPAVALALTLGTCLVECPNSGLLYQKWERRWMEMGWPHVKPQFDAILQHIEQDRPGGKDAAGAQGQPAGEEGAAEEEFYAADWPAVEKLKLPEWRWLGRAYVYPGPPQRVVFYWPQGHMDLDRVVVHDPSGEILKIRRSGGETAAGHPSLQLLFGTVGGRRLTICEPIEGDYYFCEFAY